MSDEKATPLARRLIRQIEATGPIDVATFMTLCLADRRHGYYTGGDPLCAAGDFVTAPEISQIFGELIGAALAQAWIEMGRPRPFAMIELGTGRGTLLGDALRATRTLPGFHEALTLHLVESSPALRAAQARAVGERAVSWHTRLDEVPTGPPCFVLANEFLDALPVRQFVRDTRGWRERRVGLDAHGDLAFVAGAPMMRAALPDAPADVTMLEIAPAREAAVREIALRLKHTGGSMLVIDYGALDLDGSDSLQAVRAHRAIDPLAAPGRADLTSHVAFRPLLQAITETGLHAFGPLPQGDFLRRLGIELRLRHLLAGADAEMVTSVRAGVDRLIDETAMGMLFKVIAASDAATPPAGFTADEEWT